MSKRLSFCYPFFFLFWQTHTHFYTHTHKHTFLHTHTHTFLHTHTNTNFYTHTHKHTFSHTQTHTFWCKYILFLVSTPHTPSIVGASLTGLSIPPSINFRRQLKNWSGRRRFFGQKFMKKKNWTKLL